jgi:opacity protein-like surface antigen
MKKLAAIFALGAMLAAHAAGADTDKAAVSRDQVLKAISDFQSDPSSRQGAAAGEMIINFARTSSAVHITLSHAVVPWMKKGDDVSDADTRNMLLQAYVAGNIGAQLKSGKAQDDVYEGWEQVLETYTELLAINPAAKISEVEDLKKKEAAGKLQSYAAEVGGK